jgi:hypothetical protein
MNITNVFPQVQATDRAMQTVSEQSLNTIELTDEELRKVNGAWYGPGYGSAYGPAYGAGYGYNYDPYYNNSFYPYADYGYYGGCHRHHCRYW